MDKLITFLKELYNTGQLRYVTCGCNTNYTITATYTNTITSTHTNTNDSIIHNHTFAYHTYLFDHTYGRNSNSCCLHTTNKIKPLNTVNAINQEENTENIKYNDKIIKSLATSLSKSEYENLFLYVSSANITLMDFYYKITQYKQYITDLDILRTVVLKECIDNLPLIYACIQELDINPATNNITIDTYLAIIKQLNTSL